MNKKSSLARKTLSFFLTLTLIVSSFGVAFSANAISPTGYDTISAAGFSEAFLKSDKNLLYGYALEKEKTPSNMSAGKISMMMGTIDANGNETSSIPKSYVGKYERLTDGTVESHSDVQLNGETFWKDKSTPRTDIYFEMNFKLDSKYSDLKLLIAEANAAMFYVTDYSIFASSSADDLYSSPVVAHKANTKRYNVIPIKKSDVQYISIRVYSACTANAYNHTDRYVRFTELSLTGSSPYSVEENSDLTGVGGLDQAKLQSSSNLFYNMAFQNNKTVSDLPANSFTVGKGSIPADGIETFAAYNLSSSIASKATSRLVNGITDAASGGNNCDLDLGEANRFWTNSNGSYVKRTDMFQDIIFNLGSKKSLSKLLIADAKDSSDKFFMKDYSVFISDTADELFMNSPVISHANNTKRFNLFDFKGKEAQYIAIRVYSVCTAAGASALAYIRATEFALFESGSMASASVEAPEVSGLTKAMVNKDEFQVGETAIFTTTNDNEDLVFKGWKDETGEIVSTSTTYSVAITDAGKTIKMVAVYEFASNLLIKENFEGNITLKGPYALTVGTAQDFDITPREGAESSKILQFNESSTTWGYITFIKNGQDIFHSYALEENSAYKISFWYYVESAASDTKPLFICMPHDSYKTHPDEANDAGFANVNGKHKIYGDQKGKWIKSEQYFYTYDIPTLSRFIVYTAGDKCTTGVVYIDDIKLEKAAYIEIDANEDDITSDIEIVKNHVGETYNYKYGKKEIVNCGSYNVAPTTGKIITSVTVNGVASEPEADGSFNVEISENSKVVVDSVAAEGWARIFVDKKDGTGKFVPVNETSANYAAKIGESYSFKFITGENANPVVTVDGEVITPVDGIYTIPSISEDTTIKIVCKGDEYRGVDGKDAKGNDLTKYVKELYDMPLWEGEILYHETVTIYEGRETARLLYPIDEIVSVRTFDLKKDFTWGVDYDVNEKGELVILDGNSFPCYDGDVDLSKPESVTDSGYLQGFAIDVTFKHSTTWEDGYQKQTVESGIEQLPKLYNKLQNRENVELVFYGASSTVGWSSSGLDEYVEWDNGDGTYYAQWNTIMIEPFIPTWARQTHGIMKTLWGYDEADCENDITFVNKSCAGKKAAHGANETTLTSQFAGTNPDVVVLGFSGNDGTDPNFISHLKSIITWVRANKNPDCEFIVASSSLPITSVYREYSLARIPQMEQMCKDYEGQGVLYAPTLAFSQIAFETLVGCDYVANNHNHYNDFGARAFTSVMYGLLSKPTPEYTVTFNDYNGITLKEVKVKEGESVAEIAKEIVPEKYGYIFSGWNNDVHAPIVGETIFTAIYKRDVEAKYKVTINNQVVNNVSFDTKITVNAAKDVLWVVNDQKFHVGESAVMYSFGDMLIEARELGDIDKNEPFVSLLGTQKADGIFIAFVHVYAGANEIAEYGANFWNADNEAINKNVVVTIGNDAMISLYGIKAGAKRGVKAYAKLIDGTVIYSEARKTEQF